MKKIIIATGFLLLLGLAGWADSPENLYQAGKGAFEKGYFQLAIKSFTEYMEDYPEHGKADNALFLTALAYFYLKDYSETVKTLARLEKRYPHSQVLSQTSYWTGAAYFYLEKYADALAGLSRQEKSYPQVYTRKNLYLKGLCLQKLSRYSEARQYFLKLLSGQGDEDFVPNLFFQLGTVEMAEENFTPALEYFRKLLTRYPESELSFDATFFIGECYYFLNNFGEAEKRYLSTLKLKPNTGHREKILYHLGSLYYNTGKYDLSMSYLSKLEKEFPASPFLKDAERIKPALYFHNQDYAKAIIAYKKMLSAASRDEEQIIHYNIGLACMALEQRTEALEHFIRSSTGQDKSITESSLLKASRLYLKEERFDEAISFLLKYEKDFPGAPNLEEVLKILALAYAQKENHKEAVKMWDRLLRDYIRSIYRDEYHFRRALAAVKLQDYKAALTDLNKVIQLYPSSDFFPEAYYNIGYIYTVKEEYVRSSEYYRFIIDNEPPGELWERALLARGINSYNLGLYQEALPDFENLVKKNNKSPWSGSAYFYMGKTRLRFNDLENAAQDFRKSAAAYGTEAGAAESLYWKGWTEFRLNWLLTAKETFLEAVKRFPSWDRSGECFFRAGLCEAYLNNYRESNTLLNKALERESSGNLKEEALYQKGINFLKLKMISEAREVFDLLESGYPQSILAADGFFRMAEEIYNEDRWEDALKEYIRVIKKYGNTEHSANAVFKAAAASMELGKNKEAIDYYLEYIIRYPGELHVKTAFDGIKKALTGLGTPQGVTDFYNTSINNKALSPAIKDLIRFEYAYWLFDRDMESAYKILESLKNAGMEEPLKSQINLLIGDYVLAQNNPEGAYFIYKGIAGSNSGETGARAAIKAAEALLKKNRTADAQEEYLKISFLFPDYREICAEALFYAYGLALKREQKKEAEKIYKQLKEEHGESSWFTKLNEKTKE